MNEEEEGDVGGMRVGMGWDGMKMRMGMEMGWG